MNTVDKRQRFFTCHSDNVVSLALHKKYTRASGSTGAWQPSRPAVSDSDECRGHFTADDYAAA
jgi:hypothetical protein